MVFNALTVKLACRRCRRTITLPLDVWQRAHDIDCEQCGLPLACIAAEPASWAKPVNSPAP